MRIGNGRGGTNRQGKVGRHGPARKRKPPAARNVASSAKKLKPFPPMFTKDHGGNGQPDLPLWWEITFGPAGGTVRWID